MTNYINNGIIIKSNEGKEEIENIPYNLNNIFINKSDIIEILNKCKIKIKNINNINIFREAFTHKSYCKKDIFSQYVLNACKLELGNPNNLLDLQDKSYERLEYLGDKVLKLIISSYLYTRYPKQDEGFMTKLQTKIEDKKTLSIFSKELGLGKFFIISKQIESMNGRNLDKIHEDIFESFIGALYESEGKDLTICRELITYLLETLIDYSDKLYCDNNYKDILLRFHHQRKWNTPIYYTICAEGPAHKKKYIMAVEKGDKSSLINNNNNSFLDKFIGFGIGSSKKDGEQNASKMALILYGILKNDQYTQNDIYYPTNYNISNIQKCDYINSYSELTSPLNKFNNNIDNNDNNNNNDNDNNDESESNFSINSEKTI